MTLEHNIDGTTIEIDSPQVFKEDKLYSKSYISQIGKDLKEYSYFEEHNYDPMDHIINFKTIEL